MEAFDDSSCPDELTDESFHTDKPRHTDNCKFKDVPPVPRQPVQRSQSSAEAPLRHAVAELVVADDLIKEILGQEEREGREVLQVALDYLNVISSLLVVTYGGTVPFANECGGAEKWAGQKGLLMETVTTIESSLNAPIDINQGWTVNTGPGCYVEQESPLSCLDCRSPNQSAIRARIIPGAGRLKARIRVQVANQEGMDTCSNCDVVVKPKLFVAANPDTDNTLSVRVVWEPICTQETKEAIVVALQRIQGARNFLEDAEGVLRAVDEDLHRMLAGSLRSMILLLMSIITGSHIRSGLLVRKEGGGLPEWRFGSSTAEYVHGRLLNILDDLTVIIRPSPIRR